MSFGDFAQSGFYGWEYGGVYLNGVIVVAGYGYCLAFPFEACGGVHDCVGFEFKKKSEENTRFPPTIIRLFCE